MPERRGTTLQEAGFLRVATQDTTRTCTKAQGFGRGGPRALASHDVDAALGAARALTRLLDDPTLARIDVLSGDY